MAKAGKKKLQVRYGKRHIMQHVVWTGAWVKKKNMTGTIDAVELRLCLSSKASSFSHMNSLYYYYYYYHHLFFN